MKSTIWTPISLLSVLFGLCLACGAQTDPAAPVSIGRWTSRFVRGGLRLDFDGVPLLKGGLVQVFAKDYGVSFGSNPPVATVESLSDKGRAYTTTYRHSEGRNTFQATQRIEVHPNNTVLFVLRAHWDGLESASLEWNPVRLWAYPFIGATFEADRGDGLLMVSRHIGRLPHGKGYPESNFSPPYKRLAFRHAPLGDLMFTTEVDFATEAQSDGPILFDGREDPYLKDDKLFWGGYPNMKLSPGQEITRSFTMTLTPKHATPPRLNAFPIATPERRDAGLVSIPDAQRPELPLLDAAGHPLLVPQPKRVKFLSGDFLLKGKPTYFTKLPDSAEGRRVATALRALTDDLQRDSGLKWTPGRGSWNGRGLLVAIQGTGNREQGTVKSLLIPHPSSLIPPEKAEAYSLRVTPQSIVLIGKDAAGAFYGLQTLRQLLHVLPDGTFAFAGADITDWPALRFRGAHIFTGRDALPFHRKLIERIFSRYKLNAMVIECEYSQWKSHPEIHVPFSMPLDDLRADVAFAREHFLEPIPLINSLGHSEWIFKNGQHLDLAEDVNAPHAYDASNPRTYAFLFDIYQEALDIFQPRRFHIGHDEVKILGDDVFGKYPARPENIRKGVTALFVEDTKQIADWLRERGARTMLWGDMLLHSSEGATNVNIPQMTAANAPTLEEAQKRRALLPKDAIIADWRYEPGSEQRNGLRVFQEAGFEVLGCPWYEPENIRGWTEQAVQHDALGLLQTTWAGYDSNEAVLDTELRQFTAYVLTAQSAWEGSTEGVKGRRGEGEKQGQGESPITQLPNYPTTQHPTPNALSPFHPFTPSPLLLFTRSYRGEPLLAKPQPGWYLSLRRAANINLFGGASDLPFSAYWKVVSDNNTDTIDIPLAPPLFPTIADVGVRAVGIHFGGVMLQGLLNPARLSGFTGETSMTYPEAVWFPVNAQANRLAFLHATGFGVEAGARVGTYTAVYADGQRVEIPLRYGQDIRALDDSAPTAYQTSALTWGDPAAHVTLRLLRWTNPRPNVAIERLEFRADNAYAAPILFAIVGNRV